MYSIIIPAYNEEVRIEKTLILYDDFFRKIKNYEILVVSDGQDKTSDIVRTISKKRKKIKLLTSKTRLGKGGGVLKGFKKAKGNFIGFVDADASVRPPDLFKLFQKLDKYDCAIGSRRINGAKIIKNTSNQRILSRRAFNFLIRIMFNLKIKDTQCGAKVFTKESIDSIKNKLISTGFEFDVEILWRLNENNKTIIECPITWTHNENSKFSLFQGIKMIPNTIKIRLSK